MSSPSWREREREEEGGGRRENGNNARRARSFPCSPVPSCIRHCQTLYIRRRRTSECNAIRQTLRATKRKKSHLRNGTTCNKRLRESSIFLVILRRDTSPSTTRPRQETWSLLIEKTLSCERVTPIQSNMYKAKRAKRNAVYKSSISVTETHPDNSARERNVGVYYEMR